MNASTRHFGMTNSAFYFEEICEVTADGDLKLEFYRLHAVVGDVEIFMHATVNPAADGEAKRARRNHPGFRRNWAVGKENPRRVIGDSSAVQQFPRFSISVDDPTADNARSLIRTVWPWWMEI